MKHAGIALIVLAAMAIMPVAAQDTKPTADAEPEFSNVFFGLVDGKLIPLERQIASVHVKGGVLSGFSGFGELSGPHSPVRFSHANNLQLIVKPLANENHDPNQDPDTIYHVREVKSKKKVREWLFGKVTASHYYNRLGEGLLPVKWTKYGNQSLRVTLGSLPAGEYCASPLGQEVAEQRVVTVFCFGVD
jgi:hypothetical protein